MSFMNDVDIYKKMVSDEIVQKACPIDENTGEFMEMTKCEHIEETLVVGEEIVVDENMDLNRQAQEQAVCEQKETQIYFKQDIDSAENVVEYVETHTPLPIANADREKWLTDDIDKHSLVLTEAENQSEVVCTEVANEDQDGDEETIATFVTAAGQQLALYAVEDSEEIFAVAVYDESGDPPTNFQFLMKADVERLIGEGAVRTVKKPTQIKKQLLTTQPPIFFSKPEPIHVSVSNDDQKVRQTESQRIRQKRNAWTESATLMQDSDLSLNVKSVPNIIYTAANKQPDVTYVMMDNCPVNIAEHSEDCQEEVESDGEIIEQSTVQYILFDGDQSDSELTFDEIQTTLQKMKALESKSSKKPVNNEIPMRDQTGFETSTEVEYHYHHNLSSTVSNHSSSALAERKYSSSRQELIDTLTDSTADATVETSKLDLSNGSVECTSPESTQTRLKAKRSRKQQLTSVNREDTEIIIQPASLLTEEENNVRKRGKRKRRVVPHSGYHQRESKRMKKMKHKEVEIIEIDVDEEESMKQSKRDVVEITIDDSKDKYSSDKENEIIMVGDSDEESQQSDARTTLLQCQHCSRNFRQQRALETHLRVCSKSPSNAVKFNEQKLKNVNRTNENGVKKQYACKICQEIFDVVVALARHVRSEHSQRKKRRYSKSSVEQEQEPKEVAPPEARKAPLPVMRRVKRKKVQRPNCSWEVKKLSCTDCGRWFPSAALLRAHCLQHGTKKSEQQIRRCQVCKKLIKSRLLFIRHLKKHATSQQNTRSGANMQKKLHTTRSVTRKITSLRKRGRPRKL